MATLTQSVTEALVGTDQPADISREARLVFLKYAKTDEKTGEQYLEEEEFINAIAPQSEDYVGLSSFLSKHPSCLR